MFKIRRTKTLKEEGKHCYEKFFSLKIKNILNWDSQSIYKTFWARKVWFKKYNDIGNLICWIQAADAFNNKLFKKTSNWM